MAPRFDSPPSTPLSFSQPRPRPPRSPGRLAQIRAQNRRRAYLEKHSNYFESNEHELADPLLYDSLIRRFQTPSEREAEGREKGYARVLEGSLLRGEERLAKLREQTVERNQDDTVTTTATTTTTIEITANGTGAPKFITTTTTTPTLLTQQPPPNTLTASQTASLTAPPKTRAEGLAQWEAFLRDRFVRGEDADFDYALVDEDDEYDVLEREEREEAWFEAEDPGWADSGGSGESGESGSWEEAGGEGRREGGRERVLSGETGVQDF